MRFSIRRLMIVVAGFALIFVLVHDILSVPSHQEIHSMGNLLATDIEEWRARHGRYPPTLADAGLTSPTRYLGGFRYGADRAGLSFILSIGRADGAEVQHDYTSSDGRWYCHD